MGYDVLAIEAGLADVNLGWLGIENLDPIKLRDQTLFSNFRCREIEPLFQYIKDISGSENPLYYTGFDTQLSGSNYTHILQNICDLLTLEIDVDEDFSLYQRMYQATFEPDSSKFVDLKTQYHSTLLRIKDAISKNRVKIRDELQVDEMSLKVILKALSVQYEAVDYYFSNRMNGEYIPRGIALRDSLMADNIMWIMEELYPDKKIVVWGHNAHTQKGSFNNLQTKWMGQHLKEFLGDDYFSIGLFAYQGQTYQHWTGESQPFENNDSNAIEFKMKKLGFQYAFEDFTSPEAASWVSENSSAFEPENGGKPTFVASDRFDAGICIYTATAPDFSH